MHIRLTLDVIDPHASRGRRRLERDVELPAVPRVGDWVDVNGSGVAQAVAKVVFAPQNSHVDVVLEAVEATAEQLEELLHVLPTVGWNELRPADRW